MAFSNGQVSTESAVIKRYIGVGSVSILAINPNKETLEKLFGRTLEKEPEYIGKTTLADGTEVPQVRLDFIIKVDPTKYLDSNNNPIDLVTRLTLFISKSRRTSSKGTFQVIDKYGRTAWVTPEQAQAHEIPVYANGKPANIDKNYRAAYNGEEDLINLLKTYLNIPNVDKWVNGAIVGLIDNPADAEASLEHIEDYFKGDFKELKTILGYQPNNKFKVLFGVRNNSDDGRQYQTTYTRMFLKNGINNYDRLAKHVNDAKNAGALSTSEFDFNELHEYVVESTNFESNSTDDLPFDNPWA